MQQYKIGNNYKFIQDDSLSDKEIVNSWNISIKRENEGQMGLRNPQFGALAAIQSHWTVSSETATVVMPTGTGKTETMILTIASEKICRTVIVVPSDLLRKQTSDKMCSFGILKEIGVVEKKSISPNVVLLKTSPKSEAELNELLVNSNVLITTTSLIDKLEKNQREKIIEFADLLIIDEAHHVMAKTWLRLKNRFANKKILQFTATPFRMDGQRMDGKIIYNYPLYKAQREGYFTKINFYPVYEFNEKKSDFAIARRAVECLEKDIDSEKKHILLVRAKTINRAKELFDNIYSKYYSKHNPVLIVSKSVSVKEKKTRIEKLKKLESRIVVCVDMFGEGIDIPNLKIAAIHDKYKSLPIILQFVGRFARSKSGLGEASVITNVANETLKESLKELYSQDSDWNSVLADMSEQAIGRELTLQELERGFQGSGINGISIKQLLPKVSMQAFKVKDMPKWDKWKDVLDEACCKFYLNIQQNILIIIEQSRTRVDWSKYRKICNLNWKLHIVYFNKEKSVTFVNTTVKNNARSIIDAIFSENKQIKGECIFRCLDGINRLMLGTVGLNSGINGPIRYKMFAGIDIAQGITEAQRGNSTKSNLFGVGYDGNGKVSIGCSYKGIIWSRWVENIDFWIDWCNRIIDKVMDESISVENILKGVLIPKEIIEMPEVTPYRIDWPIDLDLCNSTMVYLESQYEQVSLMNCQIRLMTFDQKEQISFKVETEKFYEKINFMIDQNGYYFTHHSGEKLDIHIKNKKLSLLDFFKENPPRIKFVDQSTLEGNYYISLLKKEALKFSSSNIFRWDWKKKGVDIKVESQGLSKKKDSIQYYLIQWLEKTEKYDVIFDDDNSGEIADVIAVNIQKKSIDFEFYHCKYSQKENPGQRIADLYEVCGQAEKSVEWKQDMIKVVKRMEEREKNRINQGRASRFEIGDFELLQEIENRLRMYPATLKIFIVQPGVKGDSITEDMNQVLMACKTYLKETYGIPLNLICS